MSYTAKVQIQKPMPSFVLTQMYFQITAKVHCFSSMTMRAVAVSVPEPFVRHPMRVKVVGAIVTSQALQKGLPFDQCRCLSEDVYTTKLMFNLKKTS